MCRLAGRPPLPETNARPSWKRIRPPAIPSGTEVCFQMIVQDPSVVWGFTMSNGVKATTP